MKAIKITTDDVISVVDIQEPTLKGMQEHVGGYIEVVRPYGLYELNVPESESLIMICNEDDITQLIQHENYAVCKTCADMIGVKSRR